jgi:hypothetical protein
VNIVKALWRGEVPLWKTYWVFGFCVSTTFNVALLYLRTHILSVYSQSGGKALFWIVWSGAVIYGLFILVAIWRSAGNYNGSATYAVLARVAAGIGLLAILRGVSLVLWPQHVDADYLQRTAASVNSQVPVLFDGGTRLEYASASGMAITYHYTLTRERGADAEDLVRFTGDSEPIHSSACRELRSVIDAGGRVTYEYADSDDVTVGAIVMDRASCDTMKPKDKVE